MIRRLAPRRLGEDEEATVVEHLTELRHRVFIVLFSIVPAFAVCFYFHVDLITWLSKPLPDDTKLVTFGVVEPFTTAVKVSALAALAIVLPILVWQIWGFLRFNLTVRRGDLASGLMLRSTCGWTRAVTG